MFLLDSNTVVYAFKGKGRVKERLQARDPRSIVVSSIVRYELEYGILGIAEPAKRRSVLDAFLDASVQCPFGETEAKAAAHVRRDLERKGEPIGPLDVLIAGTALAHGWTLVTHNLDEFKRVPGLKLEDWF